MRPTETPAFLPEVTTARTISPVRNPPTTLVAFGALSGNPLSFVRHICLLCLPVAYNMAWHNMLPVELTRSAFPDTSCIEPMRFRNMTYRTIVRCPAARSRFHGQSQSLETIVERPSRAIDCRSILQWFLCLFHHMRKTELFSGEMALFLIARFASQCQIRCSISLRLCFSGSDAQFPAEHRLSRNTCISCPIFSSKYARSSYPCNVPC